MDAVTTWKSIGRRSISPATASITISTPGAITILRPEWYGLFADGDAADSPFVGIVTQHTGAWRLPDSSLAPIVWTKQGEVLAKLRMGMNAQGTPMNLFSTAQIDPSLPQTCGRRLWLLALGSRPVAGVDGRLDVSRLDTYRNYDGFIKSGRLQGLGVELAGKAAGAPARLRHAGTGTAFARQSRPLPRQGGD